MNWLKARLGEASTRAAIGSLVALGLGVAVGAITPHDAYVAGAALVLPAAAPSNSVLGR